MSFEALRSTNIDEDLLQENELEDADANSDIVIDDNDLFLDLNSSAIDVLQEKTHEYGTKPELSNTHTSVCDEYNRSTTSSCDDYESDNQSDDLLIDIATKNKTEESFFSDEVKIQKTHSSFMEYRISRQILKAINDLKFEKPTPVQTNVIPLAMKGKDLCVSAVTGSGKTAAFLIPILERLTYKDSRETNMTRVLILVPTRELGVQCHEVCRKISRYTNIQSVLCIGGTDSKIQNAQLSQCPDIVIGTPGRIIDHLTNTPSFNLDALEILVIDEADKMLDTGFSDELDEIINNIPKKRQTLLFSATMTDKVERLAKLSLIKPIKLFIDSSTSLPTTLSQEFVKIKSNKEEHKIAVLLSLCIHTIKGSTIVFFNEKYTAHKAKLIFDLCKHPSIEFHGNLSQKRRLEALNDFKTKKCNLLLSTDVAARGLDILTVKNVINYDMPNDYSQYVHRVGRTARANTVGRSISLVCERDRKIVKLAIENSASKIKNRILDPEVLKKYRDIYETHQSELTRLLKEEKVQKSLEKMEMDIQKTKNMIEHREEIFKKPKKKWFKSSQKSISNDKPFFVRSKPSNMKRKNFKENTSFKNKRHK